MFGSTSGHGFIASGGMTTLVDLPGYASTTILGLNAPGNVGYGEATGSQGSTDFVDNGGVLTTLPAGDVPVGVDTGGDVLIDVEANGFPTASFLLNGGVVTPVEVPGYDAVATAISRSGVLAGVIDGPNYEQYFVGTPGDTAVYDYPYPSYAEVNFAPTVVNDAGDVGLSGADYGYAAIVQNGIVQEDYEDPLGAPSIIAINSKGEGIASAEFRTALLTPGGGVTELSVAIDGVGTVVTVTGLNDEGLIVGIDEPFHSSPAGFTAEVPCFAGGTLIAVPAGQVAVEDLREGDLVRTAGGALRAVVWTGRRVVDLLSHSDAERARPVVIRAGAFGPGVPMRDLRVSPDHAIACDDVLIPAKCLVNGTCVFVDAEAIAVAYHHLELDTHDLLLAEGLAAESFLDTGNRASLMPNAVGTADFSSAVDVAWFEWEARGCRRLVLTGPELDRARASRRARRRLGRARARQPGSRVRLRPIVAEARHSARRRRLRVRTAPDRGRARSVLIPTKCLVNGANVLVDRRLTGLTDHHIKLATHDFLLAEGPAAESCLDTGNRRSPMPGTHEPADFEFSVDGNWFCREARDYGASCWSAPRSIRPAHTLAPARPTRRSSRASSASR